MYIYHFLSPGRGKTGRTLEQFGEWRVRISARISVEKILKRWMDGWIPPSKIDSTEIRALLRPAIRLEIIV